MNNSEDAALAEAIADKLRMGLPDSPEVRSAATAPQDEADAPAIKNNKKAQ